MEEQKLVKLATAIVAKLSSIMPVAESLMSHPFYYQLHAETTKQFVESFEEVKSLKEEAEAIIASAGKGSLESDAKDAGAMASTLKKKAAILQSVLKSITKT